MLGKRLSYAFPRVVIGFFGHTVLGLDVQIHSNRNGFCDASDNLVVLLTFGAANSTSGGVMAYGASAFAGRLISISAEICLVR